MYYKCFITFALVSVIFYARKSHHSLERHSRVVIYNRNMFIIQATDCHFKGPKGSPHSPPKLAHIYMLGFIRNSLLGMGFVEEIQNFKIFIFIFQLWTMSLPVVVIVHGNQVPFLLLTC